MTFDMKDPAAPASANGVESCNRPINSKRNLMPSRTGFASHDTAVERVRVPPGEGRALLFEEQARQGVVTQDGAALLFVERYGDHLRFDCDNKVWFAWDGMRWHRDRQKLAFSFARSLSRELSAPLPIIEMAAIRKVAFARDVEVFASSDQRLAVTSSAWDQDPYLLGTPGGTVDLRTGEVRAPRQADMITRSTAVAPSSAGCPTWRRFLDETFGGDADIIRFVQQFAGYCLTGDTREQCFVFGEGCGGNGKGVLMSTLLGILADYGATVAIETLTASNHDRHPTELARLRGARLVAASETESGRRWAEARIKLMTGGDKITARFMRQDDFEFLPQFKLVVMGNNRPSLRNVNEAMRRRLIVLPFANNVPIERRDPDLGDKLKAEWRAILSWAIEGCLDWQNSRLTRPQEIVSATDKYFDEQNLFGQWMREALEPGQDSRSSFSLTANLIPSWSRYAEDHGEEPGTAKAFAQNMRDRGFEPTQKARGRGYEGVRLLKQLS